MRTKTFEVWITRDTYADAPAWLWLRSREPKFVRHDGTGYWEHSDTYGALRDFCYRRFVQLTGIVVGRGKKRLVQFTMRILDG